MTKDFKDREKGPSGLPGKRKDAEKIAMTILNDITEGVMVLSEDYRVIWANKQIINSSGLGEGEIVDNFCYKITHHRQAPCEAPHDICPIQKVMESGNPSIVLHTHFDKNNKERHVEVSAYPLKNDEGKISEFVHIARDVTERVEAEKTVKRLMEKTLKKSAALEKALLRLKDMQDSMVQAEKMNAIGRLASGIAHEVKNPLGIIKQCVEYLEGKMSLTDAGIAGIVQMMKDNITRADNIVRILVDFSRKSRLCLEPGDINSILENSLTLIQHRVRLDQIEIVKHLEQGLPKVRVDKNKMEEVLINILLNSADALPRGGKIFIRTYARKITEIGGGAGRRKDDFFNVDEDGVVVEIEDTGAGIAEELLKKVFDPFFTTKDIGKGTGLGLWITKNIIDMHKGLIEMKSKVGEGTKTIIMLKITRENQHEKSNGC